MGRKDIGCGSMNWICLRVFVIIHTVWGKVCHSVFQHLLQLQWSRGG